MPERGHPVRGRHPSRFRLPVRARLGRRIGARPRGPQGRIHIPCSIFQAWKHGRLRPSEQDLVSPLTVSPLSRLVVFLLDVSDSMSAALEWMRTWVATAMELAYLRRDPVAVIIVQGQEAEVLVHPTTSLGFVMHRLTGVRVGGGTPLDRGLIVLRRLIVQHREEYPVIDVCLLTDAKSTGSLDRPEVVSSATGIARQAREVLLINPGAGPDEYVQSLVELLGASFLDSRGE